VDIEAGKLKIAFDWRIFVIVAVSVLGTGYTLGLLTPQLFPFELKTDAQTEFAAEVARIEENKASIVRLEASQAVSDVAIGKLEANQDIMIKLLEREEDPPKGKTR